MGTEAMLVFRTDVLKKLELWNWIHNCHSWIKQQSKEPPINPLPSSLPVLSWKPQTRQVFEILELEGTNKMQKTHTTFVYVLTPGGVFRMRTDDWVHKQTDRQEDGNR
jgi:hypothetical protein